MKSAHKVTVRVEMHSDGHGRMSSLFGELDTEIPPAPELIKERVALLKICNVGDRLMGVGRRMFDSIYYVYLTGEEAKQITEEIERVRRNAVDG